MADPATSNVYKGFVVLTPTLPLSSIANVFTALAFLAKSVNPVVVPAPCTVNLALGFGLDVPIPIKPVPAIPKLKPSKLIDVVASNPITSLKL